MASKAHKSSPVCLPAWESASGAMFLLSMLSSGPPYTVIITQPRTAVLSASPHLELLPLHLHVSVPQI